MPAPPIARAPCISSAGALRSLAHLRVAAHRLVAASCLLARIHARKRRVLQLCDDEQAESAVVRPAFKMPEASAMRISAGNRDAARTQHRLLLNNATFAAALPFVVVVPQCPWTCAARNVWCALPASRAAPAGRGRATAAWSHGVPALSRF